MVCLHKVCGRMKLTKTPEVPFSANAECVRFLCLRTQGFLPLRTKPKIPLPTTTFSKSSFRVLSTGGWHISPFSLMVILLSVTFSFVVPFCYLKCSPLSVNSVPLASTNTCTISRVTPYSHHSVSLYPSALGHRMG